MKKTFVTMVIGALIVFLTTFVFIPDTPAQTAAPKQLKIGVLMAYTGPASIYGTVATRGIELFLEDVKASGGLTVGGQKYEYVFIPEDTKYMAPEGKAACEKLVYRDKVKIIMGPASSAVNLAVRPILKENNILALLTTSLEKPIGPDLPYVFNMLNDSYSHYAAIMKQTLKLHPQIKTVMVFAPTDATGKAANGYIQHMCSTIPDFKGIKLLETAWFERGTKDFYPLATSMKGQNPDCIVNMGAPGEAALICKAVREVGYKGVIWGINPYSAEYLIGVAGKQNMEGFIHSITEVEGPYAPKAVGQLKKRYDAKWKPWYDAATIIYDTIHFLNSAIKKANSIEVPMIAKAMEEIGQKGWEGTQGHLIMTGNKKWGIAHQLIAPSQVVVIRDGKDVNVGEVKIDEKLKLIGEK